MPAPTDHEARRRDVSEAVWRVLARHGYDGLTLRAVAAEMGASTGLLTHYFPSKQALIRHALQVSEEHSAKRPRRDADADGLAALRAALLDVLPLDPATTVMNRVWVSSWDVALGDRELGAAERARYRRWRARLRPLVEAAQRDGDLPPRADTDDLVATVAAFTHGLVVQALFDPRTFPHHRQVALLDAFLESLACR
ncbi:MAG TPA: TetR/AcrR family transcriptional regulator [Jatrophihabitantaceae bacterium]